MLKEISYESDVWLKHHIVNEREVVVDHLRRLAAEYRNSAPGTGEQAFGDLLDELAQAIRNGKHLEGHQSKDAVIS